MHRENAIEIPYSNDIPASTGMSRAELAETARLAFAAKLFHDGGITLGQAAKLCEQGRIEFMDTLVRHGYSPVNLQSDDADDELRFANAR